MSEESQTAAQAYPTACDPHTPEREIRVAILQRVCTSYRVNFFRKLSDIDALHVRVFIGDDVPDSKVRNANDLTGLDIRKFPTKWVKALGYCLPVHKGIKAALREYAPDVILSEGQGNLFSSMAAIRYRKRHKAVPIVDWGLGGLPGKTPRYKGLGGMITRYIHRRSDWFVVYSCYGKDFYTQLGIPSDRITVAVNVCDTPKHLSAAATLAETQSQARDKLNLPQRFTTLYVGAVDHNKRLDVWLEAAATMDPQQHSFVLIGDGAVLSDLRALVREHGMNNVFITGRITEGLPLYYRAADVLILPGRGGIVISEAMAYSLPVVVFQADGTEYDLVQPDKTGIRLTRGDADDFRRAMEFVRDNAELAAQWGRNGHRLISEEFSQENMVRHMVAGLRAAIHFTRTGKVETACGS